MHHHPSEWLFYRQVFISYRGTHGCYAICAYYMLEAIGVRTFIDKNIGTSKKSNEEMLQSIRMADVFVCILTATRDDQPGFLRRGWPVLELCVAIAHRRPLAPFVLDSNWADDDEGGMWPSLVADTIEFVSPYTHLGS